MRKQDEAEIREELGTITDPRERMYLKMLLLDDADVERFLIFLDRFMPVQDERTAEPQTL